MADKPQRHRQTHKQGKPADRDDRPREQRGLHKDHIALIESNLDKQLQAGKIGPARAHELAHLAGHTGYNAR